MSNSTLALLNNTLQSTTPQNLTPATSSINSTATQADATPLSAPEAIFLRELLASIEAISNPEEGGSEPQKSLLPTPQQLTPEQQQALALQPQSLQILPSNGKQSPPDGDAATLNIPLATTAQPLMDEGTAAPIARLLNQTEATTPIETALPLAASAPPEVASQAVAVLLGSGSSSNKGRAAATLSVEPLNTDKSAADSGAAKALFAGAPAITSNTPAPTVSSSLPSVNIATPMNHANFGNELGNRVMWMVKQDVQIAELRITPPNLGPLEVRVNINQDQATIAFTAQHGAARDALEANMPRLREMLGEQGLNLADVDISQHSFAEQQNNPEQQENTAGTSAKERATDSSDQSGDEVEVTHTQTATEGWVDYFA